MVSSAVDCRPSFAAGRNPLRFERRGVDRWPLKTLATAFRLTGEMFGVTHQLRTLDCSSDGMAAICDTVIEPGTLVSLGFHSPGAAPRRGMVLRCTPCGAGYRVALQFQAARAA